MRNLFRGLEILEINGRYGFEGVASVTDRANIYTSTEASLNGSITFPQFLFPFGEKAATRMAKYNPRTRLLAGFTFTERPEYTRSITTVTRIHPIYYNGFQHIHLAEQTNYPTLAYPY